MAYERKPNTGTLWTNSKKESPKHPDMTGDSLINGKQYRIAGWFATDDQGNKRLDRDGNPFMNLSFSLPDPKYAKPTATTEPATAEVTDEDLPF